MWYLQHCVSHQVLVLGNPDLDARIVLLFYYVLLCVVCMFGE
jgi:hypothetical protein